MFIAEGFDLALARKLRETIVECSARGADASGDCADAGTVAFDGAAIASFGAVNASGSGTIYF